MIKPGFEARAYKEINTLIDEGEQLLNRCSLENFMADGDAVARQSAIETWLEKAEAQLIELLIEPENATPFSPNRLVETIDALNPQPPSAAQLRRAFGGFLDERLRLLNAMIGRQV